jgi:adenosylhomocysteinase
VSTSAPAIADAALAPEGRARIEWAGAQMSVLTSVRERFVRESPLTGLRIGACLHVTSETANLIRTLLAGGAEVALCASNPLSTQDDTAAALVDDGALVQAVQGEDISDYYRHIDAVCDRRPQITLDDGADLISHVHGRRLELTDGMIGATEETRSGLVRLRVLEAEGRLAVPVIASGEGRTRHLFDNLLGTGQSTIDGILRATNVLLAGSAVVVVGYGACGRGIALRAKAAGAKVIVCEVDPARALEAASDGYAVMPSVEAAPLGDVFITVTGNRDVLARAHFERMRDGAILANAGHFDVEISKRDLDAMSEEVRRPRPHVTEHVLADARRIRLLAEGRVVNLAAAEGHPAAVMDVSFAGQALCVEHIARAAGTLEPRVYDMPPEIDAAVAELKLEALGIRIDALTDAQKDYLATWRQGT